MSGAGPAAAEWSGIAELGMPPSLGSDPAADLLPPCDRHALQHDAMRGIEWLNGVRFEERQEADAMATKQHANCNSTEAKMRLAAAVSQARV